jgi:hypothetical protein
MPEHFLGSNKAFEILANLGLDPLPKSHEKTTLATALTTPAPEGYQQNQVHTSLSMVWG